MGILSSTCSQNKKQSKHDLSTLKHKIRNSTSLDRDFYFKTTSGNNNNTNRSKYSHSFESAQNSKENSNSSLMNSPIINKQSKNRTNKSNHRPKSVRNINIHLINSSDNLKRPSKSVSLSALDQIHIIITNIDLTSNNSGGVTPSKKILHDKIYSLVKLEEQSLQKKQLSSSPKLESISSSCSSKRRPRKFSQLKTRKSYLLETKSQKTTSQEASSTKLSRSQANISFLTETQQQVLRQFFYLIF